MSTITCINNKTGKTKTYFFKSLDAVQRFIMEFILNGNGSRVRTFKEGRKIIEEILLSVSYENEMEKKIFQQFKIIPEDSEYYDKR